MTSNPIGVTFAPSDDQSVQAKKNWQTAGGSPEAIQILSLHVPQFAGARALAPDALLQQQTGGGNAMQSVVESILRNLGHEPNFGAPPSATPRAPGTEGQDLLTMIRQAIDHSNNGGHQRYEPTPSVTPGVLPGGNSPAPMPTMQRQPQSPLSPVSGPWNADPTQSPFAQGGQFQPDPSIFRGRGVQF